MNNVLSISGGKDSTGGEMKKRCTKCGETKPLDEFHSSKRMKDGHSSRCKECIKDYSKKWYTANHERAKEKGRKYYLANSEKIKTYGKKWNALNSDKVKEATQEWQSLHPDKVKEIKAKWRSANPEKVRGFAIKWRAKNPKKIKEYARRSNRKRRSTPSGKLNTVISNGIRQSLKNGSKAGKHWESLVGYTIGDLKTHLEKQFKPGMSWGNYGKEGWSIDHKVPISAFNFEVPENPDFRKCWALDNLQPMWSSENIRKSNKLDRPFQPSFAFTICPGKASGLKCDSPARPCGQLQRRMER
jgi:hypothetical protein